MVTVSVLLSEYQKSMGRMHSAYLALGTACRRAFAMGLHKDEPSMPEQILEKHRTTVWCLYVQEGLAHIAEQGADLIYGRRYTSLEELYDQAETVNDQLREVSREFGIGAANRKDQHGSIHDGVASLHVHNDAAQDAIVLTNITFRNVAASKTMRFNGFFLDAACVVLLYDLLQTPAKYTDTVDYLRLALWCYGEMTQHEPITNCQRALCQILQVVMKAVSRRGTQAFARLLPSHGSNVGTEAFDFAEPPLVPSSASGSGPQLPGPNDPTVLTDQHRQSPGSDQSVSPTMAGQDFEVQNLHPDIFTFDLAEFFTIPKAIDP
ncbi:hypothetical protein E8E14_003705 [Neopestalotiopsis sp. 37M]|nr:hypothetical protein E8E14_003705 [Neopestalotiopsis sp. 37M]